MDRVEKLIASISLLLFFAGCVPTKMTGHRASEYTDPFHIALAPQSPALPGQSFFDALIDKPPLNTEIILDTSIEDEFPEDDFPYETESPPIVSEADLAEPLSKNLWVPNTALINMLNDDRASYLPKISPEERQRRDQYNRISMSDQERAKRQNQHFDYVDGSLSDWRWMHREVDRLYAIAPEHRGVDVGVFLRDKKYRDDPKSRILRANAAILLGRDGKANVANYLLQLVRDNNTDVKIRCAATEVLGHMPTVTADDLIPLLEDVKERKIKTTDKRTGETKQQQITGTVEIWTELLIAIAEKIDPWEHDCFLEPFYATTVDIRLKTAKIWRQKSLQKQPIDDSLPEKFLEIARRENNSSVRSEIVKTLGAWQVPDLFTVLKNDLHHPIADVRNAAMHALADAKCQDALPMIKKQLGDSNAVNRAEAVAALRKLGALDDVFKLENDQDYRVRIKIAEALAGRCTPQTVALAKSYLSERVQVQLATVEAIDNWSIEESGPLLLIAAKSLFVDVRCRATEILAQKGVTYTGFDPADRPANQTEQHEELVYLFRDIVGIDPNLDAGNSASSASTKANNAAIQQVSAVIPNDPALLEVRRCLDDWSDSTLSPQDRQQIQRRLTTHGKQLMPLIDHLMTVEKRTIPESLDKVFAEVEPMFVEIEKLKSGDMTAKQKAAGELARLGTMNHPSKLAAKRIIDLTAKQSDPMVLTSLLSALRNADPELVCQLARPLLQSESAAVRRLACEMLAQFGSIDDIVLLERALRDPSREVVRGALSGIDSLLMKENADDSSVVGTLKGMLLRSDQALQTDTAATLHRLGLMEGTDALRRLAASKDKPVKLYAVRTISGLEDPVFISLLLRLLDDGDGSIRSEALKGLPGAAGEDIGRADLNPHSDISQTQQQITRWKAWGKEHGR